MPDVRLINPTELAPPRGYSHVALSGDTIWLAGQISSNASGAVLYEGDLVRQFRAAITNVRTALLAAGSDPAHVVKLTIYVTDLTNYRLNLRPIGEAYRAVFGAHYPAMSLFEISRLFEPDALVEIECIAVRVEHS